MLNSGQEITRMIRAWGLTLEIGLGSRHEMKNHENALEKKRVWGLGSEIGAWGLLWNQGLGSRLPPGLLEM